MRRCATLWTLAGFFIAAAITQQLLQIGATYFSAQLAWASTNRMRRDLATHVLYLDMSYHTATSPGDIIERVDGDVAALANFFSQFVLQIVGGVLAADRHRHRAVRRRGLAHRRRAGRGRRHRWVPAARHAQRLARC